jgi:hypothetical protein
VGFSAVPISMLTNSIQSPTDDSSMTEAFEPDGSSESSRSKEGAG